MNSGKGMLSGFSELIGNDDIKKTIGQAGGLLAIVVIAYEIVAKAREEGMTDNERAHNRLLKYVLRIIKESLKGYEQDNNIKERIYQKIGNSFDKPNDKWDLKDWNSNLPEHPAIKEILEKIDAANVKEYKEVAGRIKEELTMRATSADPDYKVFDEWWTRQDQYRKLIKHLEEIESLKKDKFDISNNRPLQVYYVDDNVIKNIAIDTLNLKDDEVQVRKIDQVQVHNGFQVKKVSTAIQELILDRDRDQSDDPQPIVIAGSFGIGKTSAMKMLSADYATKYLDSSSLSFPYIPIFVSLEKEKENKGMEFSELDRTLNKIAPEGNEAAKKRRILIFFDGLEKYKITTIKIGDKIKQLRDKGFRNVKAIITMNLNQQLLSDQNIEVKSYTRMLPFNSEQLDEFFEKYEVKEGERILTHERAIELGLPVQEMFRPLFAWIFAYQETSEDSRVKIVEKGWKPKMKKAWMFYIFFHRMIAGKPMEFHTNDIKERNEQYLSEKYLLRAVAALKQIHGLRHEEPIPHKVVEKEIKNFAIGDVLFDMSKVEKSYFLSVHYDYKRMEKMINFVHESFSDYLLAEYYIWTILIDKKLRLNKDLRLNIGFPHRETIDFLEGILDLLNEDDKDVEKYISSTQTFVEGLLTSFHFTEGLSVAKEELIDFTSDLIKERHIIFYRPDDNPDKNQSPEGMWLKVDSDDENYKLFWIHRWICLYILNKLITKERLRFIINNEEKLKERLANLIKYSGNLVPGYIKNLRNTDLSGADLRKANLFRADLSGADLKDADLSEADLTDVNMSDANLLRAKLPYSVLSRANLSDSNFEKADLSNAKLSYAILSYANLSGSKLSDANLSYTNFSDASLTSADLSNAELSYANFSDATLTDATLKGCKKIENLVCHNANFNGVKMNEDDKKLLEHLHSHKATNISEVKEPEKRCIIPPEVKITIPSRSQYDVPTSSIIMATFNDTIAKDSINEKSFNVYTGESPEKGSPVKGSLSLLSPQYKTAVFIPNDLLKINTRYHVKITSDVHNIFGGDERRKMKDDMCWEFSTANSAECKRLAVLGITASGDDGNVPSNAIDNKLDSRWTDIGRGKWIQMDLGEPKNISYLQIAWFKGNRRIYDYEITFFDDIEKFEKEDKILRKEPNLKSKESLLPEIIPIEGNVKARYVRIRVNGNTVNNWASITSIGIFGLHS